MLNKEDLGKLIEKKRKEKKLTQKELASKIGVVNTAVYKYENGLVKNIPLENRILISDILDINKEFIFSDSELKNYFSTFIVHGIKSITPNENAFSSKEQYNKYLAQIDDDYNNKKITETNNALYYITLYLSEIMGNNAIDYFDDCMVLNLRELTSSPDCCFILDDKYILIDYSKISEEDKERIIGITAKYDKPYLFNKNH